MIAFYARTDLISTAIANEHTRRADDTAQHTAELETITGRITATQAAIDRYLAAFETGTLDDATCGTRIAALTTQLDQLTDLIATPPQPVSPETIEQIHQHLTDILHTGTPGQRKAVMETHIAEIRFDGDQLIPIYRIPVNEFRTQVGVVARTTRMRNRW